MKIGVVGLGAAGCRSMMLLKQSGHEVIGFDARSRVGGRLHTIKSGNGFYEAGGEWIDADQHRVMNVLRELGMQAEKCNFWPGTVRYEGETCLENNLWEETQQALSRIEDAADELSLDLEPSPWENVIYASLDEQSVGDFLDKLYLSPRARWYVEASMKSDEGEEMQNLSLLGWLVFQMQYSERDGGEMSAFRFPTGAQTFCEKMVESSDSVFHLNRALTRVERNPLGVDLFFGEEMHSFDRVILTLPPTCFDDIEFEPALSDAKQLAFENLELSRTTKVALEFDSKFWEINRLLSDGAYEQVWDGTRADGTPTLLCYLNGDGATPDIENLIDELDQAIPGVKQHLKATQVYNWREDAHAKGGFPFLAPGYVLEHMEHLPRSEDRIHFAGDYTSPWFGFIEGALESAERVCKEIG